MIYFRSLLLKVTVFVFFSIVLVPNAFAQLKGVEWIKVVGDSLAYLANVKAIDYDKYGNAYAAGTFRNEFHYLPGPDTFNISGSSFGNIFITKINSDGDIIWLKILKKAYVYERFTLKLDNNSTIYLLGNFGVFPIDFDPGPDSTILTSNGNSDVFVLKLDSLGEFIWAKSFGGLGDDYGNDVFINKSLEILVTGEFKNTVDFNPGIDTFNLSSLGAFDAFILKLDTSGNFEWVKQVGNTADARGVSIFKDDSMHLYITGAFGGVADFDPDSLTFYLNSSGLSDIFIMKLDSAENFVWAKKFGGIEYEFGRSHSHFNSQNIYLVGGFAGTVDFDPGTGNSILTSLGGYADAFLLKLNKNGELKWVKQLGGINDEAGRNVYVDKNESVYVTGWFNGSIDIDPNVGVVELNSFNSNNDIFIAKYDSVGNFLLGSQISGLSFETPETIVADSFGNIYLTGWNDTASYVYSNNDTMAMTLIGFSDGFIVKFNQCINQTSTFSQTECFEISINSQTYFSSGSYYQYMPDTTGCDSIIILNLTINNADSTISQSGPVLTSNTTSATYQWLDCNNNFSPIPGETNQTFTATQNGNYAVEVTENGCTDTSACYSVSGIGVENINFPEDLKIFPNPVQDKVFIEWRNRNSDTFVKIMDITGKIIYSDIFEKTGKIEVSPNARPGIYILEISDGNFKAFQKLIIE